MANYVNSMVLQALDSMYKTQLTSKIGCYKLVELMYNRLSTGTVKGQINAEYCNGKVTETKTELLKKLVRYLVNVLALR